MNFVSRTHKSLYGWTIKEGRTPQRCCARCGVSWSEYLRSRRESSDVNRCMAYGRPYYAHLWIWWEPASEEDTTDA
jgi:hypothetical protein